jgi:hypothetical protein
MIWLASFRALPTVPSAAARHVQRRENSIAPNELLKTKEHRKNMLKMKVPPNDLLKTKGQRKCSQ